MEVTIVSRDTIKPAATSSSLHRHQKPYKLCIIDQLIPATYTPMVFFYPITDPNFNLPQTLANLKNSLSRTLTLYYPFSGRTQNNLYINDFDVGVPYLEAQVKCSMFEFLDLKEIELLNRFIPLPPFRKETEDDHDLLPLIAFQVSVFACGGISIGVSLSHKIFDGVTADTFLKSWAAICRGDHDEKTMTTLHLNLSQASLTFPARDDLPQKYIAFVESLWFQEKNYVTRRFVFDAKAIATLRDRAKSELVPNPTRVETLTCFLWKHAISASRLVSTGNSQRASIVAHAVNLRRRLNPPMADNIIGNIIWFATALNKHTDEAETTQLCDLLKLLRMSFEGFDKDYLQTFCGEEGLGAFSKYFNQLQEVMHSLESPPETYGFTSWTNILSEIDFGWGRPVWIGAGGSVGPAFRNFIVLVETQWGNGIEAWVTLDKKQMATMEKDPQFLAFASPNPRISGI
ncbi:vinorine synthase-like [Rosa rugosa]|uniref:vinorine synthase-like n=1 Tax=Rosa rugosa TaxID=74645 RepID=UPI002B41709B|nr:vinorine synthase-like [Rosa rugosa]